MVEAVKSAKPGVRESLPEPTKTIQDGVPVMPVESKEQRFVRLAVRRTNKALKAISYLVSLGNRSQYSFTPQQAKKIVDTLAAAVGDVDRSFSGNTKQTGGFTL